MCSFFEGVDLSPLPFKQSPPGGAQANSLHLTALLSHHKHEPTWPRAESSAAKSRPQAETATSYQVICTIICTKPPGPGRSQRKGSCLS